MSTLRDISYAIVMLTLSSLVYAASAGAVGAWLAIVYLTFRWVTA